MFAKEKSRQVGQGQAIVEGKQGQKAPHEANWEQTQEGPRSGRKSQNHEEANCPQVSSREEARLMGCGAIAALNFPWLDAEGVQTV